MGETYELMPSATVQDRRLRYGTWHNEPIGRLNVAKKSKKAKRGTPARKKKAMKKPTPAKKKKKPAPKPAPAPVAPTPPLGEGFGGKTKDQ